MEPGLGLLAFGAAFVALWLAKNLLGLLVSIFAQWYDRGPSNKVYNEYGEIVERKKVNTPVGR